MAQYIPIHDTEYTNLVGTLRDEGSFDASLTIPAGTVIPITSQIIETLSIPLPNPQVNDITRIQISGLTNAGVNGKWMPFSGHQNIGITNVSDKITFAIFAYYNSNNLNIEFIIKNATVGVAVTLPQIILAAHTRFFTTPW